MTGLTSPTYSVQVTFTDPFDTPDFVDITRWVKSGTTKRGRQHELQRAIAGTCSLTISNQDGRFSTFNAASPYVNLMTGADSYFADQTVGISPPVIPGTWKALSNMTTPGLAGGQGFDSLPALFLFTTGTGNALTCTATGTAGYAVTALTTYGFQAQFKTAVTSRTCSVGVAWYNSGGTQIGSNVFGTGVSDATGIFTKATLKATAPTGAVSASLIVQIASPVSSEVHYVTRCMISQADQFGAVTTGWAPGGRGLVPARPVKVLATWSGTQYPVYYGYIDSWIPAYGVIQSDQVITCTDGMNLIALPYLTTSDYSVQVLADGAIGYWRFDDPMGSQIAADAAPYGSLNSVALGGHSITFVGNSNAGLAPDFWTFGQPSLAFGDVATSSQIAGGGFGEASGGYVTTAGWTVEALVEMTDIFPGNVFGVAVLGGVTAFVGTDLSGNAFASIDGTPIGTSTLIDDGSTHHVGFTWAQTGHAVLYIDGVNVGSATAGAVGSSSYVPTVGSFAISQAESFNIQEFSLTPSVLTAGQIAVHSELSKTGFIQQQSGQRIAAVLGTLGVPSALQTIATGISAVQAPTSNLTTTSALSHVQTVENTEQGFFYCDEAGQFTYRDRHYVLQNAAAITSNGIFQGDNVGTHFHWQAGSLVPGDDALDLWNDAPVSAQQNATLGVTGDVQDAPDADSKRWYRSRTLQGYTAMLQTTDTEALSLSQWLVAHYKTPIARVRQMKLDSIGQSPSNLPQMLGRKLLDRITVIWQPIDGTASPFIQDSLIESIQHDFTPEQWTTTWGLSVAETQKYFTLNDPVLGVLVATGSLVGNRLGY